MPLIDANGIRICYQEDGARGDPPVLLLHGLGCQLIQWPDSLVAGIAAAGFHVVRIDNRDVGLSEKLDALGPVDIMAFFLPSNQGRLPTPPYTLADMSDDAAAVLDALGLAHAHVAGVSMGGMIAQRMAIRHPQRVLSLTSIMSSSGAPNLPAPDPAAIRSLMAPPVSSIREEIIAQVEQTWNLIGGAHYKSTEVGIGRVSAAAFDR
jgi:pimeloyl-ACP methyl ester carboxylesterase